MNTVLIETTFAPDQEALLRTVGLERDSDEAEDFLALLARLQPLAKPKAAFISAGVAVDGDTVLVGGTAFRSTVLADKLAGVAVVWPHVATCGREMYEYAGKNVPDPFERYWCDEIMHAALIEARAEMLRRVEKEFSPGKVSALGPGSLAAWPIEEQAPLFRLLAEGAGFCGIELTPTMLMLPQKSISGILFPNAEGWESCSLCPRDRCPNRRAPYNAKAMVD